MLAPSAFTMLRQMQQPRRAIERCELCAAEVPQEHRHLIEPSERRILCACRACALLFDGRVDGRFRLIPEGAQRLDGIQLSDAQWDSLRLPINLAFFFHSSAVGRMVAIYPSPAGAMESLLSLEALDELNGALGALRPDVEALLVNRIEPARDIYQVPIDRCYHLVGLLRTKWRGLSGGAEAWQAVRNFFARLA
jgi:hypothetical protein